MTKKAPIPKRFMNMRLPMDLVETIHQRAAARQVHLGLVMEQLLRAAIAQEAVEKMQQQSLPLLREVLGEDQAAALEELRKMIRADVRADIVEITSKQTDRLAALQVRVGRSAALTWRLIYRMVQKQFGSATAEAWYTESRDLAGKAMATKVDSGKEIDQ